MQFIGDCPIYPHPTVDAIAAAPDDDQPRIAFAGWLDTQVEGDWAELIRSQCALASGSGAAYRSRYTVGSLLDRQRLLAASVLARRHDAVPLLAGESVDAAVMGLPLRGDFVGRTWSNAHVVFSRGLVAALIGRAGHDIEFMSPATVWPVGQVKLLGFEPFRGGPRGWLWEAVDDLLVTPWFDEAGRSSLARNRDQVRNFRPFAVPRFLFDDLTGGEGDRGERFYPTERDAVAAFDAAVRRWFVSRVAPSSETLS